jgi:L-fuculokinase
MKEVNKKAVLILDCGATNVKACLIDTSGKIIASRSLPNVTAADPFHPGGLIWDINDIWNKLAACCRKVNSEAVGTEIIAITATTFGVDGAAVKKDGTLCYPVISWQCKRTEKVEKSIDKYFNREWLYQKTGIQSYHFNTINKLIWLKENKPDVLDNMDYYLLMSSLVLHRLTGAFVTDTTMAGTTMLTEIKNRTFSSEILGKLDLSTSVFPHMVEPGNIVGNLTREASEQLGIKAGIHVIASGHDTQFSLLGSGACINQPVLSSGTWEIFMARTKSDQMNMPSRNSSVTIELDAQPGIINPGIQWVASGVLEWFSKLLYPEFAGDDSGYSSIIEEAGQVPAGCNGVFVTPELYPGGLSGKSGNINGLMHETTRAHIYRACLEALSYYACYGLDKLQKVGNYQAENVICVGGGSKNFLWNQIRADVLGIPVQTFDMKETTALGAALTAMIGVGVYKSVDEAFGAINNKYTLFEPRKDREKYREFYLRYEEAVFGPGAADI